MVGELKRSGIPIHGVGFQVHQEVFRNLGMSALRIAPLAQQLQKQGIAAHVAEVSIPIYPPIQNLPDAAKYELQAKAYAQLLETALEANCASFTVWGVSDRHAFYTPPRCDRQLIQVRATVPQMGQELRGVEITVFVLVALEWVIAIGELELIDFGQNG